MNINHYSYKGIGETVLTFKTYKNLNKGDFIRLDTEGTAVLADANSEFVGVVLAVCEDHVSVLVKGFIELPMSSASAFPASGARKRRPPRRIRPKSATLKRMRAFAAVPPDRATVTPNRAAPIPASAVR